MKHDISRSLALAAALGALSTCAVTPAFAAEKKSAAAMFHVTESRGPVRTADITPLKAGISSEILAGPTNDLESAYVIYTRMAPGAGPSGLFTLPVDHSYLVLTGKMKVQIGTDQFVAEKDTLVYIPAGIAHQVWNGDASPEADLEVMTPKPSRDIASMMKPAAATKVENAAQYIRVPPPMDLSHHGVGAGALNERVLADRDTGSPHMLERLDEATPGSGRGELHMHPFDQIYWIRAGTMSIHYGLEQYEVPPNSLVIIHAGTAHSNLNNTTSLESHVTLMLPQNPKGVAAGVDLEIMKGSGGPPPPKKQ